MNLFMSPWGNPKPIYSSTVLNDSRRAQLRDVMRRSLVLSSIYLDHMEDHLFEPLIGVEPGERSVFTVFANHAVILGEHDGLDFNGEGNTLDMSKYKETLMNTYVSIDTGQDYSNLNSYPKP